MPLKMCVMLRAPLAMAMQRLLEGCAGMSDAGDDAGVVQIMQQLEAFIMLRRHRHDLDEAVGRLLITLELLHIRCDAILLRLCALIYLIQIRSFKMDTEDLCTLDTPLLRP